MLYEQKVGFLKYNAFRHQFLKQATKIYIYISKYLDYFLL